MLFLCVKTINIKKINRITGLSTVESNSIFKAFNSEKQYKEYVDQILSVFPENTSWEEDLEDIITEYE